MRFPTKIAIVVRATPTSVLMALVILRLGALLREREALQRELTFRAQHDTLTGLANRELFRHHHRRGARPHPVNGREVHLTASVGYYTGTGRTEPGEALQNADLALYAAKEAGRNRAVRYDPSMRAAHQAHSLLAEQLRAALEHGGFTLHYQPVVDVHTCGVRAVEALLRFTAPDGTPVSPARCPARHCRACWTSARPYRSPDQVRP